MDQRWAAALASSRSAEVAARALAWGRTSGVFQAAGTRAPEALVVVASVFASLCAPPRRDDRHVEMTARLLLLFFSIDDAPANRVGEYLAGSSDVSIGPLSPQLRAWLSDLEAAPGASPEARAWFGRAFRDYISARAIESAAHVLSLDEHWKLRRRTIFMDPYVAQWAIWAGVDPGAFDRDAFAEAYELAIDLVLLSNDLGSVERDREGGEAPDDLSLVAAYRRERGWSQEDTIDRLVAHHNEMVVRYRAALEAAIELSAPPAAQDFADLVTGVVDGNLETLWTLDFRYRGVEPILERLEWVVARPAWRRPR